MEKFIRRREEEVLEICGRAIFGRFGCAKIVSSLAESQMRSSLQAQELHNKTT